MAAFLAPSRARRALALVVLLFGTVVLLATSPALWDKNDRFERTLRGENALQGLEAHAEIPAGVAQHAQKMTLCATVVSSRGKDSAHLIIEELAPLKTIAEVPFEQHPGVDGEPAFTCASADCRNQSCKKKYRVRLEGVAPTASYQVELKLEVRGRHPEPPGEVDLVVR